MSSLKSTSTSRGADRFDQTVSPEAAGSRLDQSLAVMPGIVSREMARRLIVEGAVVLNGKSCEPSKRVKQGDLVSYRLPPPETSAIPPEKGPLDILHEDRSLVVINKPPGLSMHPGPGHRRGTLVNLLLGHCSDLSGIGGSLRPGIVHRLDMGTSGLMVAAKNDSTHRHLARQLEARTLTRRYKALVWGTPEPRHGKIEAAIGRNPGNRKKMAVVKKGGKAAVTRYRVLKPVGVKASLLECRLATGRTHQIRVHMSDMGHPVVGDPLYGGGRKRRLRDATDAVRKALAAFDHQALHAYLIGFRHPSSGESLRFEAEIPSDFKALLNILEEI